MIRPHRIRSGPVRAQSPPWLKYRSHSVPRPGLAALEVVMATAITLPLAALMFFLGVEMCRYVFQGFDGMLTMPWL